MDPLIEHYLETISNNLHRIANSLEELIKLNKPKEPETNPNTESPQPWWKNEIYHEKTS